MFSLGARREVTRRPRVLIVEDDRRLAFTLKIALEENSDVETVASGSEALAKLRADASFDVILSDLSMPDVSGEVLFETLVDENPTLAPRFVFMTGGAFTERSRRFLESVDNPRLDKPFDLSAVEQVIRDQAARLSPE